MSNGVDAVQMTEEMRDVLVEKLAGTNRRMRQDAAHLLAVTARQDIDYVLDITDALIDALTLPEAQTRWECLDMLAQIATVEPNKVLGAFEGAEEALFDDISASVRLSAFRFLCRYGAISPECAARAWALMSEAIQCYHGDPEYREMLVRLVEFAQGNIGDEVRASLVDRMQFDAKNGRGFMKAYSTEICAVAGGKA
ncbi:MAG: hypothetical protein Q4A07_01335 [Coriobacteriales bacterium]|nr:hypothetical protein [Coriobacteriales bacterium]